MSEWQPIATAPKDGTKILFCGGTHGCEFSPLEYYGHKTKGTQVGYWDEKYKEFRSLEDDWASGDGAELRHFYPESWMPLPEPPNE